MNRQTSAQALSSDITFWPPAAPLLALAKRIRAQLGQWPAPAVRWRLCSALPQDIGANDLIIVHSDTLTQAADQHELSQFAAAAGVLTVSAESIMLRLGGTVYPLAGKRANDWLAALAAFLDCGFMPPDALVLAHAWREPQGRNAWPVDYADFPRVLGLEAVRPSTAFAACPWQLGLYPVVASADWVERLLELGVKTIQLRAKTLEHAALKAEIKRAVQAARHHQAQLFINDHWQLAIEAGAYGVHLGQEDLQTAQLQTIANAGLRLGLSTHGYYEMLVACQLRPSYIALGAVFATTTKAMPTAPQGLTRLTHYVQLLKNQVPLVAIGGIDEAVLADVLATGVGSAAVVRAITEASDVQKALATLQHTFVRNLDVIE